MKRQVLAGLGVLLVWMLIDLPLHQWLLAPYYAENASLWRPIATVNVALIYAVTFTLILVFVGTYRFLVRPKSMKAGLLFGCLMGLALGIASGFGTYIHMPVPLALACGWLLGGWLKGLAAGAVLGSLVRDAQA